MWSLALLSFCIVSATKMKDADAASSDNIQIGNTRGSFRSLSIDHHNYLDHIDWKDVIETLMNVDCQSDHMQITFRYNTRHARLLGQKLHKITSRLSMKSIIINRDNNNNTIGIIENSTECESIRDDVHNQLHLKVDYRENFCGLQIDKRSSNWMTYLLSDTLGPMIIGLSEDARGLDMYRDKDKISIDKKIFLQGVFPVIPSSDDVRALIDLKSFPINCYVEDQQRTDALVDRERRYFLRNGCPGRDDRGRGLSTVHHFAKGDTRIGIQMMEYLTEYFVDKKNVSLSINCEIMACSFSRLHGLRGVSKCPLTTYCSIPSGAENSVFPINKNVVYNVKSRVLNGDVENLRSSSLQKDSPPNLRSRANNRLSSKCRQTCPPIVAKKSDYAHVQHRYNDDRFGDHTAKEYQTISSTNDHYISGISTKTAILLALVSFLSGALVTTLIWYFQRTEKANITNTKVYEMSSVNQSRRQLILPQNIAADLSHDSAEVSMIDSSR